MLMSSVYDVRYLRYLQYLQYLARGPPADWRRVRYCPLILSAWSVSLHRSHTGAGAGAAPGHDTVVCNRDE